MLRIRAPQPCTYAVQGYEEEHVQALFIEAAQRLGYELPGEAISFGRLKGGPYAKIGFGHDLNNKEYILFPLCQRESIEIEARLSARAVSTLFRHLHEQHWRRLRMEAIIGEYQNPHDQYDATALSRWLYVFAQNYPDKVKRYSKQIVEHEMKIVGRFAIGNHEIECDDPSIVIPVELPETIRNGIAIRWLRELMDWPSCGDPLIDEEVRGSLILSAEKHAKGTEIRLIGSGRKPITGREEDQWRQLKKLSSLGVIHYKGEAESEFDYEATISYHRSNLNKIGIRTTALIPYHDKLIAAD